MYATQHRLTRSPLSITPRPDGQTFRNPTGHVSGKGKAVAFTDDTPPPPPPLGFLNETGAASAGDADGLDDWKRFREAGLLDEAVMERKDREALAEKADRLKKELFDYQYNMGLLLIENKELVANAEELKEALAETQEVVKREEAAHFMALSEAEKRNNALLNALEFEKRCRADLEKALVEIKEENKHVELVSQTKLADANSLVAGIGDKAREVEEKMQLADAKLAEVDRKSTDLDRRLQDLETHESVLQSERQSLNAEREAWEHKYSQQRVDLREWERKLQEGEERLCEGRRIINSREEKVNEIERSIKLKEKELEDAHNETESIVSDLKKKEDDINRRLSDLIAKEEQAALIRKNLEIKQKELLDLSQKLTAKERVEIQKLLDTHKEALDSEKRKFDIEMDEKRKLMEAEMKSKIEAIEQKLDEVNHKEEKLQKLEQSLEKKSARFNDKENEIDLKSKALKEKDKSIKAEAKKLEVDKKQLLAEQESLEALKVSIEKIKDEITRQEMQVNEEIEKLRITEDERRDFSRLQLKLKEEIEKCRVQKELIMKDIDDLKDDRLKFEQEWEALDEKKTVIGKEIMEFNEQKENFEKRQKVEGEKLEKEKLLLKDYVKQQTEVIQLEKETFEATVKHKESLLVEKYENEHRQFVHDFEKRKRDLEVNLQNKRVEMERSLQEKEKAFEELREKELDNISYLKEVVRKDFEELKSERKKIDKEKNDLELNNRILNENQLEMQKDISDLGVLNEKIKLQREDFVKERNRFIGFVEKLKNCENCGEVIRNYELSDVQIPEVRDDSSNPRTFSESRGKSEGVIASKLKSWVGSTVFKLSPHSITKHQHDEFPETSLPETATHLDANGSHDDDQSYMGSKNVDAPEGSEQSEMKTGRKKPTRKPRGTARKPPTVEPVAEDNSEKIAGPTTRKRAHAETSLVSGSELDGESEVHSESVTTGGGGGRRKRRQTAAPPPQTPGESRYNLRRHKTEDIAPQTKPATNSRKKKEVSGTKLHEITPPVDTGTADEDVNTPSLHAAVSKTIETQILDAGPANADVNMSSVHATVSKTTETQILDATFKTAGDVAGGSSGVVKIVKNKEIVNVAHDDELQNLDNNEDADDDVNDGGDDDDVIDDGDDDVSDDGDEQHPGEVSIGKKIWKFLST